MSKTASILNPVEFPPTGKTHSATVIFLHALADSGPNCIEWIQFLLCRNLQLPHIKFIFPTAPRRPFTLFNEMKANIWYNVWGNIPTMDMPERRPSYQLAYDLIHDLIQNEINNGIPENRIIIGGFSMGGCMALHIAFQVQRNLAGVFALSTYMHYDTIVYETLEKRPNTTTKLLMFHGDKDDLISYNWGKIAFSELTRCGVRGEFFTLKDVKHEMKTQELLHLERWLGEMLPLLESDLVQKL